MEHHHRHHAVVLTKLSLDTRLDRSSSDVIWLNVSRTRRCRAFGTWIGRIVKTYEYINRVDKRFRLRSTRVRRQHSPLSLLCITMILHVRRIFFLKLLRYPTHRTYREAVLLAHLVEAEIVSPYHGILINAGVGNPTAPSIMVLGE